MKKRNKVVSEQLQEEASVDKINSTKNDVMWKQIEECGIHLVGQESDVKSDFKTGILPLDLILTNTGGFRSGCAHVYGHEGVGKSSLAMSVIQSFARRNGNKNKCLYIDVEHGVNDEFCKIFNLIPNVDFYLAQPDHSEAALNAIDIFLRNVENSVVVLDSVAALMANAEWSSKVEDKMYAPTSLHLSNIARKAPRLCTKSNNLLIYLNQIRDNLSGYGSPTRVPGGRAIKFLTSWQIEMKKKEALKQGENQVGQKVEFKTVKNRFTKPYQKAMSHLIYGSGFHAGYDLIEQTQAFGLKNVINKKGAWIKFYNGEMIQGLPKAADYIMDNIEIRQEIENKILEAYS
jgi:recombination protein RecA